MLCTCAIVYALKRRLAVIVCVCVCVSERHGEENATMVHLKRNDLCTRMDLDSDAALHALKRRFVICARELYARKEVVVYVVKCVYVDSPVCFKKRMRVNIR